MSISRPIGGPASARAIAASTFGLGDMERAQRVPFARMAGEIAFGRGGPVGTDGGEAGGIGGDPGILAVLLGPASEQLEQGSTRGRSTEADEHPAAPPLRRSARPASIRILTWRETRGWLCPSTCAISPIDSSMARRSMDDPEPGRIGQRGEYLGAEAIYAD
jgi:hypothetical protein